MPHTDLHKKKLKKNVMVALCILAWVGIIWAVTIIKMTYAG